MFQNSIIIIIMTVALVKVVGHGQLMVGSKKLYYWHNASLRR